MRINNKKRDENIRLVNGLADTLKQSSADATKITNLALKVMLKLEAKAKISGDSNLAELYGDVSELYARAFQHDMNYLQLFADMDKVRLACYKGV